jgi:hypothetical protein
MQQKSISNVAGLKCPPIPRQSSFSASPRREARITQPSQRAADTKQIRSSAGGLENPASAQREQQTSQTQMIVKKEEPKAGTQGLLNQQSGLLFSAALTQKPCHQQAFRGAESFEVARQRGAVCTCLLKSRTGARAARQKERGGYLNGPRN